MDQGSALWSGFMEGLRRSASLEETEPDRAVQLYDRALDAYLRRIGEEQIPPFNVVSAVASSLARLATMDKMGEIPKLIYSFMLKLFREGDVSPITLIHLFQLCLASARRMMRNGDKNWAQFFYALVVQIDAAFKVVDKVPYGNRPSGILLRARRLLIENSANKYGNNTMLGRQEFLSAVRNVAKELIEIEAPYGPLDPTEVTYEGFYAFQMSEMDQPSSPPVQKIFTYSSLPAIPLGELQEMPQRPKLKPISSSWRVKPAILQLENGDLIKDMQELLPENAVYETASVQIKKRTPTGQEPPFAQEIERADVLQTVSDLPQIAAGNTASQGTFERQQDVVKLPLNTPASNELIPEGAFRTPTTELPAVTGEHHEVVGEHDFIPESFPESPDFARPVSVPSYPDAPEQETPQVVHRLRCRFKILSSSFLGRFFSALFFNRMISIIARKIIIFFGLYYAQMIIVDSATITLVQKFIWRRKTLTSDSYTLRLDSLAEVKRMAYGGWRYMFLGFITLVPATLAGLIFVFDGLDNNNNSKTILGMLVLVVGALLDILCYIIFMNIRGSHFLKIRTADDLAVQIEFTDGGSAKLFATHLRRSLASVSRGGY